MTAPPPPSTPDPPVPPSTGPGPDRPLEGLRVLDCTRVLSGPICGRLLCDLGADVVKVEAPETDVLRSAPPRVSGLATMYSQYNVGKRNVSLDLKVEGGAELLARLAEQADVLVENFRPGVLARQGCGARALRERSPRLVYCSITGWGQEGPWADRPAYAPIVQAEAGTLALGAALRRGPAQGEVLQHADLYAGLMACNAILAALFRRERRGVGAHLDVAMGEALLYVNEHASAEIAGLPGAEGFATWSFETFRLANGRAVHVLGDPVRLFPLLAPALSIPVEKGDARFATAEGREANREEIVSALASAIAEIPSQGELEARLDGLPALVAGVRTTAELAESEWATHRGLLTEVAPGLRVPAAPWRSPDLAIGPTGPARVAWRGEHNHAVLAEWLGMPEAEARSLEARGILQQSESEPPDLDESPRRAFRRSSDPPPDGPPEGSRP